MSVSGSVSCSPKKAPAAGANGFPSPSCSVRMELLPSVDRVTRSCTREEDTGPTNSYLE